MFKDKELIIFDLDGTLIDSAPSLNKALNYMLKELNLEPISLQQTRDYIGNGSLILVKRALVKNKDYKKYNLDEELVKKAQELLLNYYKNNLVEDTTLYNGVKEGLEELAKRRYKLALATNKPHEFVKEILNSFDISKYFKIALGAGVVENKKPNPEILYHITNTLNISPSKAVMVGDSINDIKAAKNANIDSIGVRYGYSDIDIKELKPTVVCDNFKEILQYF